MDCWMAIGIAVGMLIGIVLHIIIPTGDNGC
jgi:hypothetical protein